MWRLSFVPGFVNDIVIHLVAQSDFSRPPATTPRSSTTTAFFQPSHPPAASSLLCSQLQRPRNDFPPIYKSTLHTDATATSKNKFANVNLLHKKSKYFYAAGKVPQDITLPFCPASFSVTLLGAAWNWRSRHTNELPGFIKTAGFCLLSSTLFLDWNVILPFLLQVTPQMSLLLGSLPLAPGRRPWNFGPIAIKCSCFLILFLCAPPLNCEHHRVRSCLYYFSTSDVYKSACFITEVS